MRKPSALSALFVAYMVCGLKLCFALNICAAQIPSSIAIVSVVPSFLQSPIVSMHIEAGEIGCFHEKSTSVHYKLDTEHFLVAESWGNTGRKIDRFSNRIQVKQLETILRNLDNPAWLSPSLAKYHITAADKHRYRRHVDSMLDKHDREYPNAKPKPDRQKFYSVLDLIDTISTYEFGKALENDGSFSTTHAHIRVTFKNKAGEHLVVSHRHASHLAAWSVPWKLSYDRAEGTSYSLEFSRFLKSALPPSFHGHEYFDNKYVLLDLVGSTGRRNRR